MEDAAAAAATTTTTTRSNSLTATASSSLSAIVNENPSISPTILNRNTNNAHSPLFQSILADVKMLPSHYSQCEFSDLVDLIGTSFPIQFLELANLCVRSYVTATHWNQRSIPYFSTNKTGPNPFITR
jgi:hypothetical protein